jgi:hypothetical protein
LLLDREVTYAKKGSPNLKDDRNKGP